MVRQLVVLTVAVGAALYLASQARKPSRWLGRWIVRGMNQSHSELTDWGLGHLNLARAAAILDVGCGGGRTVQKLAALAPASRVFGVDFAPGSVAASQATNAALIQEGRVEIREASVSRLPFPDATFDLVTAVETHYYWPDLPSDIREVLRVLKPGGTSIVIAEAYRDSRHGLVQTPAMALLRGKLLSLDEHRAWFETAGFSGVRVSEERAKDWMCVMGVKSGGA